MTDLSAVDPDLLALVDETRNMNELVAAFMPTVPDFATPEGLLQLRTSSDYFAQPDTGGVVPRELPGPAGPIPAWVYTPDTVDAVYLHLHGGGWCIGTAASGGIHQAELGDGANVAVVAIDYRLAPEHPYPAGPDDCEAAALWLLEHARDEWGTDRLAIGGGSAGAHLTGVTLLRLRDRHGADALGRFAAAVFDAGCFDLGMTPSQRAAEDLLVIPRPTIEACLANFLPGMDSEARRSPQVSPLYADLTGMPPALFSVGTLDPLLDDSLFMAARWAAAGNVAELAVYPDSIHGFAAFPTEMARVARARMIAFVADALRA